MPHRPRPARTHGPRPPATAIRLAVVLALAGLVLPPGAHAQAGPVIDRGADGTGSIATLRVEDRGGRWLVWADNHLQGPAEVLVDYARSAGVASRPALPARATVPAQGSRVVTVIEPVPGSGRAEFRLQVRSIPGQPGTRPEDVVYALPLDTASVRVDQGFGGGFSHQDDENRYAVDLAAPPGTPVLAARDGVVMQVETGHRQAGGGTRSGNFVRLLHRDGTMTVYAHLQPGGVLVAPGRQVRAGDRIGLSGNTGFTTGPHLHFAVQVNRGMRIESLPFRMPALPAAEPPATAGEGLRTRSAPGG